jgi:hypothetical protein
VNLQGSVATSAGSDELAAVQELGLEEADGLGFEGWEMEQDELPPSPAPLAAVSATINHPKEAVQGLLLSEGLENYATFILEEGCARLPLCVVRRPRPRYRVTIADGLWSRRAVVARCRYRFVEDLVLAEEDDLRELVAESGMKKPEGKRFWRAIAARAAAPPPAAAAAATSSAAAIVSVRARASPERRRSVSRAFPSWKRSIVTEIYLCHACSDHEIEDG